MPSPRMLSFTTTLSTKAPLSSSCERRQQWATWGTWLSFDVAGDERLIGTAAHRPEGARKCTRMASKTQSFQRSPKYYTLGTPFG